MKLMLTLFIPLLIVGCTPDINSGPVTSVVSPAVTSSSTRTPEPAVPMTTYVDQQSGIAFDYPTGWSIAAPSSVDSGYYSYSIASYDLSNPPVTPGDTEAGLPAGSTKMDINFYPVGQTVEDARQSFYKDMDTGLTTVTKEETRTAADGSAAYYYEVQGIFGNVVYVLQTSVKGRTVSVVAYGQRSQFDAVAASLRAT